jgi:hypothetical protein
MAAASLWKQDTRTNTALHVIARIRSGMHLASSISQVSAVQHELYREHPTEAVSDSVKPKSLLDDVGRDVLCS